MAHKGAGLVTDCVRALRKRLDPSKIGIDGRVGSRWSGQAGRKHECPPAVDMMLGWAMQCQSRHSLNMMLGWGMHRL